MKISYSIERFARAGCGNREENERMLILEKRIKENPNDFEALLEKGFLCIGGPFMSPDEALECLEKAVELKPDNVEALFWLAKTYYHDFCDDDKTLELLERALKFAPDRADLHSLISGILPAKDAIFHLRKAISLEPTWVIPRKALSRKLLDQNLFNKAEHEAKKAYENFNKFKNQELKTSYEKYYEPCITGRSGGKMAEMLFDELFQKIETAKLNSRKK